VGKSKKPVRIRNHGAEAWPRRPFASSSYSPFRKLATPAPARWIINALAAVLGTNIAAAQLWRSDVLDRWRDLDRQRNN